MADAKKAEAEVEAPKKKRKWLLFAIIGVVALLLAGGGAFLLLKAPPPTEDDPEAAAASKKKTAPTSAPVFYKFDKAFTVKLQTEDQEAYLQTEVQLKLLNQEAHDLLKQHEPDLKHRINLSLMNNKASNLASAKGVQRLANELRDLANKVISPPAETGQPAAATEPAEAAEAGAPVQSVLFSTFIIQ